MHFYASSLSKIDDEQGEGKIRRKLPTTSRGYERRMQESSLHMSRLQIATILKGEMYIHLCIMEGIGSSNSQEIRLSGSSLRTTLTLLPFPVEMDSVAVAYKLLCSGVCSFFE